MSVSFNPEEIYTRLHRCITHFEQNGDVSKINEEISAIAVEIPKEHFLNDLFQFANREKMVEKVALRQLKSLQNLVKSYLEDHRLEPAAIKSSPVAGLRSESLKVSPSAPAKQIKDLTETLEAVAGKREGLLKEIEILKSEQEEMQRECAKMIESAFASKSAIKKLEEALNALLKQSESVLASYVEQTIPLTALESKLSVQNKEIAELERCLLGIGEEIDKKKRDVDQKISLLEKKIEPSLTSVESAYKKVFHEFEVAMADLKDGGKLFSEDKPERVWGGEWWLKVERTGDKIGMFLCCGGGFQLRPPITVDYQLMVKRHSTDDGVCKSTLFRATFGKAPEPGKEKIWAWGLSKFAMLEQIEREGGYSATVKKIIFGVSILPVEGVEWGEHIKESAGSLPTPALSPPLGIRASAAAAPAAPAAAAPAAAAPRIM